LHENLSCVIMQNIAKRSCDRSGHELLQVNKF
jgi:hypothetical protein